MKTVALLACVAAFAIVFSLTRGYADLVENFKPAYFTDVIQPTLTWPVPETKPDAERGDALSVPVLVFHGALESPDGFSILAKDFVRQMYALKAAGYQTVTLSDFEAFVKGEKHLPAKSFLLTFDDGRKDSYYPVDPVLERLHYNAVMFVISKFSLSRPASPYYLNPRELQKMVASGRWEMESHGKDDHELIDVDADGVRNYYMTNRMWLPEQGRIETPVEYAARIGKEMVDSKHDIESALGVHVTGYAYPFGQYGQNIGNEPTAPDVVKAAVDRNYDLSFRQVDVSTGDAATLFGSNDRLIGRINVSASWSPEKLLAVLAEASERALPLQEDPASPDGWISRWGDLSYDDGTVTLTANPKQTSAYTRVAGGKTWTDYSFDAVMKSGSDMSASVIARANDDDDYVSCVYTAKTVTLRRRKPGDEDETVVAASDVAPGLTEWSRVGIVAQGDLFSCRLGGEVVIPPTAVPDAARAGSVGFKVWSPIEAAGRLDIKSLSVKAGI